jgi:two-component system sensor histidine kinase YesM
MKGRLSQIIHLIKNKAVNRTIRMELTVMFILMALFPAFFFNIFYAKKINMFIDEKVNAYNTKIIKQVSGKLDLILSQAKTSMKQVVYYIVTSNLQEDIEFKSPLETIDYKRKTAEILNIIKKTFPSTAGIYVISSYGNIFTTNWNYDSVKLLSQDWLRSAPEEPENNQFMYETCHYADYDLDTPGGARVVSFAETISGYGNHRGKIIVQIDIKYEDLRNIIETLDIGKEGLVFIVNGQNELVYYPNLEYLNRNVTEVTYKGIKLGRLNYCANIQKIKDIYFLSQPIGNTSWKIVYATLPSGKILEQFKKENRISLVMMAVWALLSAVLALLLSKSILEPINKIIKTMSKVGEGDFNISLPKIHNRDLQVLVNSFDKMVERINTLMKNLVEKETEKTRTELKALQAQINPHFLYNTLEVIRGIARANRVYTIAEIAKALALLFRYSINRDNESVMIKEEIEHVKNYIKIQKYRYGDKFTIEYQIEPELEECRIPKFIIQPLIENALYHGIETKIGQGRIVIAIFRLQESTDACIKISDDGVGMPQTYVDFLNWKMGCASTDRVTEAKVDEDAAPFKVGIGIINVNTRVKLNYGDRYGLKVSSVEHGGTTIEMIIPINY